MLLMDDNTKEVILTLGFLTFILVAVFIFGKVSR